MPEKKPLSRREFLGRIGVTAAGVTTTGVTSLLPNSAEADVVPPPTLLVSAQLLPVYSTPSPAPIEDSTNQDGPVVWASVFQGPDRKIYSVGASNHSTALANSVRCFNPATEKCELPFANITGKYVDSYDNHPSMLHYSDAKLVWYNHGVFDLVHKTWIYGNLPPTLETTGEGYILNSSLIEKRYNPAAAWCPGLDMGLFWSGSSGSGYQGQQVMAVITRNPNYPTQQQPWVATNVSIPNLPSFGFARNNAVCVGTYLYLGGGIVLGRGVTGAAVGATQLTINDPTGVAVGARLYFYAVTAKTYVRAVNGNVLTVDPLPRPPSGSYTPSSPMTVLTTHNGFYRLDLATISTTRNVVKLANWPESVELADPPVTMPTATRTNYPQLVYDSAKNRLVLLGRTVWTYDIASNTWTNLTPSNWVPRDQVMGAYDRVNDAIYFRGMIISATGSSIKQDAYTWRKLQFPDAKKRPL